MSNTNNNKQYYACDCREQQFAEMAAENRSMRMSCETSSVEPTLPVIPPILRKGEMRYSELRRDFEKLEKITECVDNACGKHRKNAKRGAVSLRRRCFYGAGFKIR